MPQPCSQIKQENYVKRNQSRRFELTDKSFWLLAKYPEPVNGGDIISWRFGHGIVVAIEYDRRSDV